MVQLANNGLNSYGSFLPESGPKTASLTRKISRGEWVIPRLGKIYNEFKQSVEQRLSSE